MKKLWRWFAIETPYSGMDVNDPLFAIYARRARWMSTPAEMRQLHRRVIAAALVGAVLAVALWRLLAVGRGAQTALSDLLIWGFWFNVGATVLVDVFCILYGVNSIRDLFRSEQYDLLRLTTVRTDRLVDARYSAALVYSWRGMLALLVVRFQYVVLLMIWLFQGATDNFGPNWVVIPLLGGLMLSLPTVILYDALWRYPALTALGVGIASRERNVYWMWLWLGWSLVLLWVWGPLLTGSVSAVLVYILSPVVGWLNILSELSLAVSAFGAALLPLFPVLVLREIVYRTMRINRLYEGYLHILEAGSQDA